MAHHIIICFVTLRCIITLDFSHAILNPKVDYTFVKPAQMLHPLVYDTGEYVRDSVEKRVRLYLERTITANTKMTGAELVWGLEKMVEFIGNRAGPITPFRRHVELHKRGQEFQILPRAFSGGKEGV